MDYHTFNVKTQDGEKPQKRELACLTVIRHKVKVIIPETEVWLDNFGERHMMRSMCGAAIEYVITVVEREKGFAIASRKLALGNNRLASRRRNMLGQIVSAQIISVGKNVCTAHYGGFDVLLPQREISYNIIPDLREIMRPGDTKSAVITKWEPEDGCVEFSIKQAGPHPFDGAVIRHPIGAVRVATIVGKQALRAKVKAFVRRGYSMRFMVDYFSLYVKMVIFAFFSFLISYMLGKALIKSDNLG